MRCTVRNSHGGLVVSNPAAVSKRTPKKTAPRSEESSVETVCTATKGLRSSVELDTPVSTRPERYACDASCCCYCRHLGHHHQQLGVKINTNPQSRKDSCNKQQRRGQLSVALSGVVGGGFWYLTYQ